MRINGEEVSHLGFGQSPFPVPKCFTDGLKEFAHINDYLPVAGNEKWLTFNYVITYVSQFEFWKGLPALKSAICEFHNEFDGVNSDPDQVVIGPGSKEIIFLTMKLFDGGEFLLNEYWLSLSYYNYVNFEMSKCQL